MSKEFLKDYTVTGIAIQSSIRVGDCNTKTKKKQKALIAGLKIRMVKKTLNTVTET